MLNQQFQNGRVTNLNKNNFSDPLLYENLDGTKLKNFEKDDWNI